MVSDYDAVRVIRDSFKFNPLSFGFAGEMYLNSFFMGDVLSDIADKYIFVYRNTCVNRKNIYYSNSLIETLLLIEQAVCDYPRVYRLTEDGISKRYVLYTITEYIIHSLCKLINLCFFNLRFRKEFYIRLKAELEFYTDILIELMFSENMPDIEPDGKILRCAKEISEFYKNGENPAVREHVEYDHKLLLIFAYIFYKDIIKGDELLLCLLLGAAQMPPFFKSVDKYFGEGLSGKRKIFYEYVKFSVYDEAGYIPFTAQLESIKEAGKYTKIFLLDESLGTGETLLTIKKELSKDFYSVKTGAAEFRWDKKIMGNTDSYWFDISKIDFISPMDYRHYLILNNQTACFKINIADPRPYTPYMIYDDCNFKAYMDKQKITAEKKADINAMFQKAKIIQSLFYGKV